MTGKRKGASPSPSAKPARVLVFGESPNDTATLIALAQALTPASPFVLEARRTPLVLVKDRELARQRKNAQDIAAEVARTQRRVSVAGVIAHQDCDAVEPAHVTVAAQILDRCTEQRIAGVPATPAWEMEAWLYLWPTAVEEVNGRWRKLARGGQHVGRITDAKQALTADLRPAAKPTVRDYAESDCPRIAQAVRDLGLVDTRNARSDSFEAFASAWRRFHAAMPA